MEYIQTILFQIPAMRLEEASRSGSLLAELDEHRAFLRNQPGFRDLRITRSINNEGNVLVVVETRWSDDSSLVRYETNEPNAASIVRKHESILVPGSLQVLDMEALRTESSFRAVEQSEHATARMVLPVAIPLGVLAALLLVIYGLSRIYLETAGDTAVGLSAGFTIFVLIVAFFFANNPRVQGWQVAGLIGVLAIALLAGTIWAVAQEDEGEAHEEPAAEEPTGEPGGPTGSPGPGPGGGLAVLMDDNFFALEEGGDENPDITATSGDELTIQNVGAAIHNIRVDGPDGEYNSDDDAVSDPETIRAGQEGTLTVELDPGEYAYQCDFHPTEMTGAFVVE